MRVRVCVTAGDPGLFVPPTAECPRLWLQPRPCALVGVGVAAIERRIGRWLRDEEWDEEWEGEGDEMEEWGDAGGGDGRKEGGEG